MQRVHIAIIKYNNTVPTVLTILDNPTNGDMVDAVFPNINRNFSNIVDVNLWRNAPYKRGTDKEYKETNG